MEVLPLIKETRKNLAQITLEATVDTGFELVAKDEFKEKFGASTKVVTAQGRIFFNIPTQRNTEVFNMRSIDNLFLITDSIEAFDFKNSKEEDLQIVNAKAQTCKWKQPLNIWKNYVGYKGIIFPTKQQYSLSTKNSKKSQNESLNVLKFRVTCVRTGTHSFTSTDAATVFGGELQDMFLWTVDLTSYDIEIILNIIDNQGYVSVPITAESLHNRNIRYFGPTTLRATICYNLLRLAEPKIGDVIIDPLGGGGSIPIEGSLAFKGTYYLCGDIHSSGVTRTTRNLENMHRNIVHHHLPVDVLQWDATTLPLCTASVDVFVTDLPFGKRSGFKEDNRSLYVDVLLEVGRVVRMKTGRAVLLTHDKHSFDIAFSQSLGFWKRVKTLNINLGGLHATAFVLHRTTLLL